MSSLTAYLQLLIKQGGSDLHLAAGQAPLVRIVGELVRVDVPPLKPEELDKILSEILSPQQKMDLKSNRQLDFSLKVAGLGVFRGNIFYQMKGLSAAFRALPEVIPSIDQLQLPPVCRSAANYANGLVLVTGPTGSGKSTTLAAMIGYINQTSRRHILTLEDPVEFRHESARSLVNQRQLGTHFNDFASALKASLREDPDVILVGEMRDPETMALAITAAETGHLVFATLHTNSAAKSIDRILDSFDSSRQAQMRAMLSESLRLVISQKLIPTANLKGRICVMDILVNTSAVSNLIREGKTFQLPSIMQTGRKDGMQLSDYQLLEAVRSGMVTGIVAWEHASDKNLFAQYAPRDVGGNTQAGSRNATNPAFKKTGTGV